ncbi:Gfo/Idh/MocA family oxidoreductase [Streptomyces sp. NPDC093111]|uniref:Gfo/Idh/MocA family protein n=1 Tax=Streptomyces sp. NPDC093111 TaxID=3154978 RepID=UPI0034167170
MPALRMAVMGCADIAVRRVMPAMAGSARVELVALASRDADKARAAARPYGCRAVHGYQGLLDDPGVEAVYVPLPCALHADWVEAALRAGKHVLAEKPLTPAPERAAELFALARRHGLALMENIMFLHHPLHAAVRELMEQRAIGELRSFRAEFTVPRRAPDDIRYQSALGGGALLDTGVYPARAALHLVGPELTPVSAALVRGPGFAVDTAGAAILRSPEGVLVQLGFGLDHGYRSAYELAGTRGRIVVDRAFTPPADHAPVLRLETGTGVEERRLAPYDQVAATLVAFADAAAAGRSPDAHGSVRLAGLLHDIRERAGSTP